MPSLGVDWCIMSDLQSFHIQYSTEKFAHHKKGNNSVQTVTYAELFRFFPNNAPHEEKEECVFNFCFN